MQEHICTVEILRTQQIRNQVEAAMLRTDLCGHGSGISAGYKALLLLTFCAQNEKGNFDKSHSSHCP